MMKSNKSLKSAHQFLPSPTSSLWILDIMSSNCSQATLMLAASCSGEYSLLILRVFLIKMRWTRYQAGPETQPMLSMCNFYQDAMDSSQEKISWLLFPFSGALVAFHSILETNSLETSPTAIVSTLFFKQPFYNNALTHFILSTFPSFPHHPTPSPTHILPLIHKSGQFTVAT